MTVLHFKIFVNNSELWDNLFLYCSEDLDSHIVGNVRKPVSKTPYSSSFDYHKSPRTSVAIYKVGHKEIGTSISSSAIEKLDDSKFRCITLSVTKESGDTSNIDQTFIAVINEFASRLNVSRKLRKNPTFIMSGYFMTHLFRTLVYSLEYRRLVINNFVLKRNIHCNSQGCCCVNIKLNKVGSFIDHKWFERIERLYIERRELDNIMAWLSTLGGGFSALGEYQPAFAYKAGKISCDQLKLALRLGDDLVVARCKLYFSLSLIQRGYLKIARKMIEEQFKFAKHHIVYDQKLVNMCQGIWVKLKYEHRLRCNRKRIK